MVKKSDKTVLLHKFLYSIQNIECNIIYMQCSVTQGIYWSHFFEKMFFMKVKLSIPFLLCCLLLECWQCGSVRGDYLPQQTFLSEHWSPGLTAAWPSCMVCHQSPGGNPAKSTSEPFFLYFKCNRSVFQLQTLTASLEAEVEDVEDGDSGEEDGEERREGDGEEVFEEVLLWGADGRTTTSSSSGTLLLHSSSCLDSSNLRPFPEEAVETITHHMYSSFLLGQIAENYLTNVRRLSILFKDSSF